MATPLKARMAPLADTARYDRLRHDSGDLIDADINGSTQEAGHEA